MTDAQPAVADVCLDVTRAFNAPRDLVWRFWTEPELVAKWFGPHQVSPAVLVPELKAFFR